MKASKGFALLLAMVVALAALLAGCGSSSSTSSSSGSSGSSGSSKAAEPAKSEPAKTIKLDIIENANNLPSPDKDIIKHELDKALNTDINLTVYASAGDYKNQVNVRVASGNFPDLFQVDRNQLIQFVKQGLLLDLGKYKDKLKTAFDFVGQDSLRTATVDGKIYAMSKSPKIPYNTYWIRKDWLDKLGMKVPTNLDEFKAVVQAFTDKDPDGNGKKDTYGLTGGKLGTFAPIFGAFDVGNPSPSEFYVKDGKLVNSLYDPAMKDALAYIKSLIDTGGVDPEIMANTGLQHQEKAIKGQAGIIWIDWPNLTKDQFAEQIKKVNPNAKWIQMTPPQGPGGIHDGSWDIGASQGLFAIPKALEKQPEKLQKVFDLLNYISDPNGGSRLVQFGVEGRHYNLENGKVVPTDLMGKEVSYSWLYQFTGRPEMTYLQTKFAPQSAEIEFANKQPRIQALTGFVDTPEGFIITDANRYIEEEIVKFIYGKNSLSNYDAFLKTLESGMNYKVYLDAGFKQLSDLGYGK